MHVPAKRDAILKNDLRVEFISGMFVMCTCRFARENHMSILLDRAGAVSLEE